VQAIAEVRKQQPAAYMKICALLVPREMRRDLRDALRPPAKFGEAPVIDRSLKLRWPQPMLGSAIGTRHHVLMVEWRCAHAFAPAASTRSPLNVCWRLSLPQLGCCYIALGAAGRIYVISGEANARRLGFVPTPCAPH
jgi:hypothetical protein